VVVELDCVVVLPFAVLCVLTLVFVVTVVEGTVCLGAAVAFGAFEVPEDFELDALLALGALALPCPVALGAL